MSDKKPFWEGKTCSEMAGLHVKVTFKNGTVATGVTDECGDIDGVDSLSCVDVDDKFVPCSYVESIELLDDPEYERIDNIEDVREGDIFVAKDGNHYPIKHIGDYGLGATFCVSLPYGIRAWLDDSAFSYALRPKPQLPDRDGLWFDKDDAIWQVCDHQAVPVYDDADEWGLQREVFSVSQLGPYAPFRPAKAVEA